MKIIVLILVFLLIKGKVNSFHFSSTVSHSPLTSTLILPWTSTNLLQIKSRRLLSTRSSSSIPFLDSVGEFYAISDCLVLFPSERIPKSIIHFVGGFIAGSAVNIAYSTMLTKLSEAGHLIIATPIPAVSTNHGEIAGSISKTFANCLNNHIFPMIGSPLAQDIPIIGLSHSLGGKLMALQASRKQDRKIMPSRFCHVFLSFNNYGITQNFELMGEQASISSPELKKVIDTIQQSEEIKRLFNQVMKSTKTSTSDSQNQRSSSSSSSSSTSSSTSTTAKVLNIFSDAINKVKESSVGNNVIGEVSDMVNDVLSQRMGLIEDAIGQASEKYTNYNIKSDFEFTPGPEETWQLIQDGYNVQRNILIKFNDDNIDQSNELSGWLRRRGCDVKTFNLPGSHLTPNVLIPGTAGETASKDFNDQLVLILNRVCREASDIAEEKEKKKFTLPPSKEEQKGGGKEKWDTDNY